MAPLSLLRSRKLIRPFAVHKPATVADALALKASRPDAVFMAGGVEIADRLKKGAHYSDVICLTAIPELTAISRSGGCLHIGAAVPHRIVGADALIRRNLPGFADAVAGIGSPRIRTQGTIGGNLMSGVWHYDVLPLLIALSARLKFASPDGSQRELAAQECPPVGSDLLVSIAIPVDEAPRAVWFQRVDKPVMSLTAAVQEIAGSVIARVVLASAGQPPLCGAVTFACGSAASIAEAAARWRADLTLSDERTSSAWYRAELAEVRLRRMLMLAGDLA